MKNMIYTLLTILLLSSCSGPMGALPPLAKNSKFGTVVVVRSNSVVGSTNNFRLTLNKKNIFSIRAGEYTSFKTEPGELVLGVTCFGGWTPTPKREYTDITVENKQTNYVLISPNASCAGIEEINATQAKNLISKSSFVSMGQKI